MHVVALFTDGTSVLVIKDKQILLPNTMRHWPLEWKKRTAKSTSEKLLKHVSFGVIQGTEGTSETIHKVFGVENTACVITRVDPILYNNLLEILQRVLFHAFFRAKCDCYRMESIAIQDLLHSKVASVETLHCIRELLK